MGITSSTATFSNPSPQLVWKQASEKLDCIPSAGAQRIGNYDALSIKSEFIEELYSNIDSEYLLDSVLQAAERSEYLAGIANPMLFDADASCKAHDDLKSVKNMLSAGIQVQAES